LRTLVRARLEGDDGLPVHRVELVRRRVHRVELNGGLSDHLKPAEHLALQQFSADLADTAHQPITRAVQQGGDGAVLLGNGIGTQLVPQFGWTVVERKRVEDRRLWTRF
jgi:hypothetical protein